MPISRKHTPTRSRSRPLKVRSRSKGGPVDPDLFPEQTESSDLIVPGIDVKPLGGLFGTAEAPAIPQKRLRSRFARRLARGERRSEPGLLLDSGFRLLWTSRLLTQTAQSALLYTLLILVVDLSNRSLYTSLFVMCSSIPALIFGLPAGVVVDTVPHKFLMVLLNCFRFLFMLFLVSSEPSLAGVFAATIGLWVIHQFYSPAEASTLGSLVNPRRYTESQAMFNLALTISQAAGLVILAPLLLKVGGARMVFALCGAFYVMSIALVVLLPRGNVVRSKPARLPFRTLMGEGLRFALRDRRTFEAIVDDVLVGVGMSALVVIMPVYLERILGTSKENTVFVFAPAGLGLIAGLRVAPILSKIIGERYSATLSLILFSICVSALGFIEPAYNVLNRYLPLAEFADVLSISPLVTMAMLISIPAGFASAIVNVAARSILLQRTPVQMRGQVIATQGLIGNIISLVPTLIAGIATDIFGVKPIAVAIAVAVVVIAMVAHGYGRKQHESLAPVPSVSG